MSRLTEHDRRIKQYATAAETAGALQDINAIKMQSIRRKFEKNRTFFDEIRTLYGVVRASAEREELQQEKGHAERVLYVAVTSNRRFAGALTRDTIDALAKALREHPAADSLVVGSIGWQYFSTTPVDKKRSRHVAFKDEAPTKEEFAALLTHVTLYDKVYVLYGRFINAFRQEVSTQEITQAPDAAEHVSEEMYVFEPELSELLSFFDAQVRYVLFERVLLESDLARTAARFVTMEESREKATELLESEVTRRTREKAAASNAALLEIFSGYAHWRNDDQP